MDFLRIQSGHVALDAELIFYGPDHLKYAERVDDSSQKEIETIRNFGWVEAYTGYRFRVSCQQKTPHLLWSDLVHIVAKSKRRDRLVRLRFHLRSVHPTR